MSPAAGRAFRVARWAALAGFGGAALLFLNSALFSGWVAGGPPTQYKEAWEHRALQQLCRAVAFALFAGVAFRWLVPPLRFRPLLAVLTVAALAVLVVPSAREFMLVDACLDSGGRWATVAFVCER
jgi:hypothetical protein